MRHLAWLNATPKPPEGSKTAEAEAKQKVKRLSRAEQLKRDKITPPMPPNPAPHIIDRLIEIGLTEAAGMGAAPISWQSIFAWQQMTATYVPPWEARLLRQLSREYLAQSHISDDENCPPPWAAKATPRQRETEEARLRMVLG